MYGDGGQSGFSSTNDALRFNTFTGQANDANFHGGDPTKWVIISAPIITSPEGAFFYPPVVADPHPANGGTIFQGSFSVWRTQDWGGDQALLEANCPEFTTSAAQARLRRLRHDRSAGSDRPDRHVRHQLRSGSPRQRAGVDSTHSEQHRFDVGCDGHWPVYSSPTTPTRLRVP